MDIMLGDEEFQIMDLLGLGFQLNFDVDLVEFVDVEWGDFLFTDVSESDVITFAGLDEEAGMLALSASRQGSVGGIGGSGVFATVTFQVKADVVGLTVFEFSDVMALDSFGQEISSVAVPGFILIFDGVFVWPGDTNNDGIVDIADVLPVGAWFGSRGPERYFFEVNWFPQPAPRWTDEILTYVDATGDGVINQNDILPIGLNFGKSTDEDNDFFLKESQSDAELAQYLLIPAGYPAGPIQTTISSISGTAPDGIIGVAADFSFDAEYISISARSAGSLLASNQLLVFDHDYDEGDGLYSVAVSRLGRSGVVTGEGEILNVTFDLKRSPDTDILIRVDRVLVTGADRQVNMTSAFAFASPVLTSAEVPSEVPTAFSLSANYPNPFNPTTTISYTIPELTEVRLEVFDVMGRRVSTLVDAQQAPGTYTANFNASGLASGMYVYRIQAGAFMQTRSMMLIK
jgi:hypothetical protein